MRYACLCSQIHNNIPANTNLLVIGCVDVEFFLVYKSEESMYPWLEQSAHTLKPILMGFPLINCFE